MKLVVILVQLLCKRPVSIKLMVIPVLLLCKRTLQFDVESLTEKTLTTSTDFSGFAPFQSGEKESASVFNFRLFLSRFHHRHLQ